jgi:hypothetical protein
MDGKHGVALEMQVARAFRTALGETQFAWDVDLGRNYIDHDPDTGLPKLRETDVVVRATKMTYGDPWVFYRASGRIDPWAQTLAETAWDTVVDERLNQANIGGCPSIASRNSGSESPQTSSMSPGSHAGQRSPSAPAHRHRRGSWWQPRSRCNCSH